MHKWQAWQMSHQAPNFASHAASATTDSFFGMASRAASVEESSERKHSSSAGGRVSAVPQPAESAATLSPPDVLTEWSWTGLVAESRLLRGLSWGVSCLKTDCRENQDGWAVQVYACTRDLSLEASSAASFTPTFSFTWNHELSSLNQLDHTKPNPSNAVALPLTPQPSAHTDSLGAKDSLSSNASLADKSDPAPPESTRTRETYIGSSTFVVLDGHGAGGRDAAAAIEKAFDSVFSRTLSAQSADGLTKDPTDPSNLIESIHESLRLGQRAIEKLNDETQRDFGTTCVSVTLANDVLISTSCGDSSALLFAFPPGQWSGNKRPAPLVVELSRRHNLEDRDELQRISEEGRGRVIRGDGGVFRLIPGDIEYEEAKRRGLSINMGRSLGHSIFKECGLSTQVDYSFLALKQIPKLLMQGGRPGLHSQSRCFRLPPLNLPEMRRIVSAYRPRPSHHRRCASGTAAETAVAYKRKDTTNPESDENLRPSTATSKENLPPRRQTGGLGRSPGRDPAPMPQRAASTYSVRSRSGPSETTTHGAGIDTAAQSVADSALPTEDHVSRSRSGLLKCFARKSSNQTTSGGSGVRHHIRTEHPMGDMFLLLMSDGVTDVLSSGCIIDMLRDFDAKSRAKRRAFDPSAFAYTLTEVATERRRKAFQRPDNCTCLAVHLIAKSH